MIEIVIYPFENSIKYDNNEINILQVENHNLFVSLVASFYNLSIGEESEEKINIFKDDKIVLFSKIATFIINPFSINFEDKKINSKLYNYINVEINTEIEKNDEFNKMCNKIITQIIDIAYDFDFDYDYNTSLSTIDIMKNIGLKISFGNDSSLMEKIIEYINVIATFEIYELIVFVNIKIYFEEYELIEIYKYAKYRKINLLLIESSDSKLLQYENKIIIDKEYDEFIENNHKIL